MKHFLTILGILITQAIFAQTYSEQINKADEAILRKDYCSALAYYKTAFNDTAKIGALNLYYAARAAANCNDEKQALAWLKKSQQKGLGLNPGEIDAIVNDSKFLLLHKFPDWNSFITSMRQAFAKKQQLEKKQSEDWLARITSNKILPNLNGKFNKCNEGFALYFSKVDSLDVPYLVYIPKLYHPSKPMQVIVFLQGGVANRENFEFQNPEGIIPEPIFSIGDIYNSIIIYPFGKKDFGWVYQKPAFENVLTIINKVEKAYNVDNKRIFLGGMSNGGTATFWFASQKPNIFKGFYAFSAIPKLEIGEIRFQNISQGKPFYSINAKDDEIYSFKTVKNIYEQNKTIATDWHFDSVQKGDHSFIYGPQGKEILNTFFKKVLSN